MSLPILIPLDSWFAVWHDSAMTQDHSGGNTNDRISADEIAARLIEAIDVRLLNHHQKSLFWDTVGLLGAVDEGILHGSTRIFTNLVAIVDQFEETEQNLPLIGECHTAILRAAESGFSTGTESHGQKKGRWIRSAKRDDTTPPEVS